MEKDRICKYCNLLFENIEGRIFSNHVRWCDKNITNGDKGVSSISKSINTFHDNKIGALKEFKVHCYKCKIEFNVNERKKEFPKKDKYFCSRLCACSYSSNVNKDIKNKNISKSLIKKKRKLYYPNQKCSFCNNLFQLNRPKKYCSSQCLKNARKKHLDEISKYRSYAKFNFNLKDFPDEFNFDLIRQHGWYKAKNHGNNLKGVSRDHIISIMEGYKQNIDPLIISHPANCQLMIHSENVSKFTKSGMTLDELLEKIKKWDIKYKQK